MKGVPWVVVILVACVYVYRETGLYRVFVTGYNDRPTSLHYCSFRETGHYIPATLVRFSSLPDIWGPLHRFTELPHLQAFSIAIFLFVRSSRNQIKHLQRFPSRTFEFCILTENYTNIRVFKLVNKERDIDKVWRDWNVYCFEEKKREKIVPSLQFWRLLRFLLL